MGASQSRGNNSVAEVTPVKTSPAQDEKSKSSKKDAKSRVWQTPIIMEDDDDKDKKSSSTGDGESSGGGSYPVPTGREYDLMDKLAADLPHVIDDESRAQVEEFMRSCDDGRGPMVACFSTAEYLSLFERRHKDAEKLYRNACFRPATDRSPNGVAVKKDKSKAYPPACFNLAHMRMTGKGGTPFNRQEGYNLFERACEAGHGGSCYMLAKILTSHPGGLGPGIPHDPPRAASLLDHVCQEHQDPISCFLLATMLLRGDRVAAEADNVTPQEARGLAPIVQRPNEEDRSRKSPDQDKRVALKRDPKRAEYLLKLACDKSSHAPSCHNLAVMYSQGDDGITPNETEATKYKKKTEELVGVFGGFGGFGGM